MKQGTEGRCERWRRNDSSIFLGVSATQPIRNLAGSAYISYHTPASLPALVTVLLLWGNTVIKNFIKGSISLGACLQFRIASPWWSWQGGKQQVGSHCAGYGAESSHVIHKLQTESEQNWAWCESSNLKAYPSDTPPPTRPYLLILPKQQH